MWNGLRLTAQNLACERGDKRIFANINFSIKSGDALELRGPNGSGKSSLLRLIAGLNQSAQGKLTFDGQTDFSHLVHYIGHHDAIKPALTVQENIAFWQKFYGGLQTNALHAFRLESLGEDRAQLLSSGQRRRLALSRLVAASRPLWLLDEPTNGLDNFAIADLTQAIKAHQTIGGLVIIATHQEIALSYTHHMTLGGQS